VHALRVATLRLQADIPCWVGGHEQADSVTRATRRWNKQAKKLRRALMPVRSADVDLAKLTALRSSFDGPDGRQLHSSRRCLRQMDTLERRFSQARRSAEKELVAELEDRRQRLHGTSLEMERVLAPLQSGAATATPEEVRAMLAALVAEFPELNEGNLHEYRMRIKAVRYLADLSSASDPRAARQAAAMGRMQVAAGEWHDLKMLAKKAANKLGDHDDKGGLVQLLEELAAESLQKALALCRRTTAQLLKLEAAREASSKPKVLKFPVRRAETVTAPGEKARA
jgi:CHAD domain-containing protein